MESTCREHGKMLVPLLSVPGPAQPCIDQAGQLGEGQELEVDQASQGFTLHNVVLTG